ncbi:MAG: PAS domain S-box protein [Rubrivivax sp.]
MHRSAPLTPRPPLIVEIEAPDNELSQAHAAMGLVSWLWDLTAGRIRWTGDLSPLLGKPHSQFAGSFDEFLKVMHPDDVEASRNRMRDCIRGRMTSYLVEERVVWPDGQVRWLETCGHVKPGADGRAVRMAGVIRDVTQRREARLALERNEAGLRRLIGDAPVAIGMSRGGVVIGGNGAFARLFGAGSSDLLAGRKVSEMIAPAALPEFERRTRRREAGQAEAVVYECMLRRLDGSEFPGLVSLSGATMLDGAADAVFVQDLSDTVRQRLALQHARDRAESYLRIARSIQLELDTAGCIVALNERGHELLGHAPGQLIGLNWFDTFRPPDEVAAAKALFAEVMSGVRPHIELHESCVVSRDGTQRFIAWRNGPILDEVGRICGLMSSGEDVTERRNADEALRALAQTLEQRVRLRTAELEASNRALAVARDAAEAGTRAKGEFLAHMSHEIRTPMNAIIGMTHLALQQPELPERARGYLNQIHRASGALLGIINDVLDFSRIESGRLEIARVAFELDEVLDRVAVLVAHTAAGKGLGFVVHVDPGLPRGYLGDPLRLGQVLLNLCGNAVKFTGQGRVLVRVQRLPDAAAGRVRLGLSVRDTGIGIAPDQTGRLFRPFEQLDDSITRRFGGTGLGLAISHRLVESMGGTIDVHSEPGRGSDFRVVLDLEPTDASDAPREGRAAAPALRCLVVDADAESRHALQDACLRIGLRPSAVESVAAAGDEAERARRDGDPFRLVLVDGGLADEAGLAVARRLQDTGGAPPARLLRLDVPGAGPMAAAGGDGGPYRRLARPVTPTSLARAVSDAAAAPVAGGTDAGAAAPAPAAAPALSAPPLLRGKRLLLVEDNDLNQIVAIDLLQDIAGARVTLATTGHEALRRVQEDRFDAVLMDLQMPDLDGFEATRRLRRTPEGERLPVIAMTAHALARDRERCLAAGMDDFVTKPIDPGELFAALARHLGRAAPAPPAVPAVDHEAGLQRCLGRADLYARVLDRFLLSRADDAAAARRELERGEIAAARLRIHTMISSAATIGADPLADTARQLMATLEGPEPEVTPAAFERMSVQLAEVLASVRAYQGGAGGAGR